MIASVHNYHQNIQATAMATGSDPKSLVLHGTNPDGTQDGDGTKGEAVVKKKRVGGVQMFLNQKSSKTKK